MTSPKQFLACLLLMLAVGFFTLRKVEGQQQIRVSDGADKPAAWRDLTAIDVTVKPTPGIIIDRAEVVEAVRALEIIIHDKTPLTMDKIVADAKKGQAQQMRERADQLDKDKADYEWARGVLAKWQQRAAELKEAK